MTEAGRSARLGPSSAFARCVAVAPDEFAERYWGQEPVLSPAARLPGGFGDLFGPAAVDELVSRRGLRTPFLRMAKDGSVLPAARFTRSGGAGASIADQAADDRILDQLADGATLVLQALHRTWPPLVDFGSRLSRELGHPVQINAYVTPPENQGFAAHYDVHDVVVLQITGRKRWAIFEPVRPAPLPDQPWENHRAEVAERARTGRPVLDPVLEPGDALYLPRGTIHAATALGETSIHLTVGIHPLTRHDLLRAVVERAADDPALRRALPMGVDLDDPARLAPELAATLTALLARLAAEDPAGPEAAAAIARGIGATLRRRTRPEAIAPLAQLAAAEHLTPDSRLRRRRGLRAELSETDGTVRVHAAESALEFGADEADALKRALGAAEFTLDELPGLDAERRRALAARLLRAGLIVPAEPAAPIVPT